MFHSDSPSNGPVNELDPAYALFRDQTRFWIQRVAVPLLMVIGLFGNLITVIIMTRRRMRSTTNMYLAALAFVDMFYLVLTFLLGLSHYPNMAEKRYYAYWRLRPFLMMLTDACSNTSVWLTVTFTIERYIAVRYPMKGKVWCTEARAKKLIFSAFAVGLLFASPVPFEWKVIEKRVSAPNVAANITQPPMLSVPDGDSGLEAQGSTDTGNPIMSRDQSDGDTSDTDVLKSSMLALDYSELGRNETYKTIYYWSTAVVFYFIPLFSLMLLNGFLIKSVHESRRERTKMIGCRSNSSPSFKYKTSQPLSAPLSSETAVVMNGVGGPLVENQTSNKLNDNQELNYQGICNRFRRNIRSLVLIPFGSKNMGVRTKCVVNSPTHKEAINTTHNSNIKNDEVLSNSTLDESRTWVDTSSAPISPPASHQDSNYDHHVECPEVGNQTGALCDKPDQKAAQSKTFGVKIDLKSEYSQVSQVKLQLPDKIGNSSSLSELGHTNVATMNSGHQSMATASSQERRITIMLIAVVILFLICQIPSAAMLLYTSVHESIPNTNEHALVLAFGNIFNFLMAVNAAGNFILYSFLSQKYRKTFMLLFCGCLGSDSQRTGRVKKHNSSSRFR